MTKLGTKELTEVWRILVVVFLCEAIGGVAGLAIRFHHFAFHNFWIGAVAGLIPGFALGLWWQKAEKPDTKNWRGTAWVLGLLALAITIFGLGFSLPHWQREMQLLAEISNIRAQAVINIEVYDRDRNAKLMTISDPALLAGFAQGISDAVGYAPNHDSYTRSWLVVVTEEKYRELELHLNPRLPESVIGRFVETDGTSRRFYGAFQSLGLRSWVEENLVPRS